MGAIVALPPRLPPVTGRAAIGDEYSPKDAPRWPNLAFIAPWRGFYVKIERGYP